MIRDIPCAIITKLDEGLIKIAYKDGYQVELEDAVQVDEVVQEFSDFNPVYIVMDTNGRYSVFSKEAQKYLSYKAPMVVEGKILAFAAVVNSLPNRLLAQIYLNFFKPKYPFEAFKSEKDALSFLNSLKTTKHP